MFEFDEYCRDVICGCFFFQAEDGIRDLVRSRGLGDVYKRQQRGADDFRRTEIRAGREKGEASPDRTRLREFRPQLLLSLIHI